MKIYKLQDFSLKLSVRTPVGIKLAGFLHKENRIYLYFRSDKIDLEAFPLLRNRSIKLSPYFPVECFIYTTTFVVVLLSC